MMNRLRLLTVHLNTIQRLPDPASEALARVNRTCFEVPKAKIGKPTSNLGKRLSLGRAPMASRKR